jgi:hypothetical protein
MIVHIVCWDGVEYDREATEEEIQEQTSKGYVEISTEGQTVFNFAKDIKDESVHI